MVSTAGFRMKRYCFILLLVLISSCAKPFIAPPEQINNQINKKSEYCSLLHVPESRIPYKTRAYLGITFSPVSIETFSSSYKCKTFIQVEGVIKNTPAAKAGIKEKDIILSVNDEPVCESNENAAASFSKMIERQKAGSIARFQIMRNKEIFPLNAEIEEKPHYHHPESEYHFSEECRGQPSLLETALKKNEAGKVFDDIIEGLNHQSDTIHNSSWDWRKSFNPFQLKEMTYLLRHPLQAGEVSRRLSGRLLAVTDKDNWAMPEIIPKLVSLLDIEMRPLSDEAEITFPNMINSVIEVNKRVEHALRNLLPEEKALLRDSALKPWEDSQWNKILEISFRIDLKELLEAFEPVLHFLTSDNLMLLKKDLLERFKDNKNSILYEEMTPAGKVIVGGTGANVYAEDAALILDLGGDDVYLNNAGGTRPGMNVSVVVDWAGNDIYLSKSNFSQGAGLLGGGFLFDLAGEDTFSSLNGSQGAGFFGIGVLYHGDGSSSFNARSFSQGVGQMGAGFLWKGSGNDIYDCREYCQALGLFRGAGVLIDRAGNDNYRLGGLEPDFRDPEKSTVSMGQGFGMGVRPDKDRDGISGGIGLLIDQKGNDTYIADYFAQGASYYYGVGILNDMAGNDRYIAGRYAQGAGIHSAAGILLDLSGDDFYYASYGVAQGMGHDYGVGYLEDSQGDDRYLGVTLVQGAATQGGLGLMLDVKGKDSYICSNNCQAFAQDEGCLAVLLDTEPDNDILSQHKVPEVVRLGIKKIKMAY